MHLVLIDIIQFIYILTSDRFLSNFYLILHSTSLLTFENIFSDYQCKPFSWSINHFIFQNKQTNFILLISTKPYPDIPEYRLVETGTIS